MVSSKRTKFLGFFVFFLAKELALTENNFTLLSAEKSRENPLENLKKLKNSALRAKHNKHVAAQLIDDTYINNSKSRLLARI